MSIKSFLKEHLSEEQLEPLRLIKQDVDYVMRKSLPEEYMLKRMFKERVGYPLNLDNPQTFNEKLQWLKLHDRNPLYTTMVDKYEVKKYVAEKIGEQYIIPTLGVWDHFDEIDFDKLPDKFVLKCTHDSGSVVLCRDKATFDKADARRKLERGLARNYYYGGYEWPYKNVKPRIIAEKFMVDEPNINVPMNTDLTDYKIMCFDGKVCCTFTCTDRRSDEGLKVTFFDNDWNKLPFERHYPSSNKDINEPKNFQLMKELAEKLSEKIPFVRVDFYEISGNIYFGELTFYPGSGMEEFNPTEWDKKLGDKIHIEQLSAGGGHVLISDDGFVLWIHQEKLENNDENLISYLTDYKIFCFDGKPTHIMTVNGGHETDSKISRRLYDADWNLLPVGIGGTPIEITSETKPAQFDEMMSLAQVLSKDVPHLRVDFYIIGRKVYFGEMTFYHWSGMCPFEPPDFDLELGKRIKIQM